MKGIAKNIFLYALWLPLISARYVNFFRKDYTYIEKFDAFYKLHWDLHGTSWNSAFLSCDDEGATLFYPKNKDEWTLVKNLTNIMTVPPNVTDIFIGIHDEFGLGEFITVDALWLPLISARYVNFFRKDYTYIEKFDAFYKLHWDLHGTSWNSAFLSCDDEGATLFYPKNKDEWTLVKNLTNIMTDPPNVTDIFIGIHDEFGLGEFITVDGHSTQSPLPVENFGNLNYEGGNCILMNINTGSFSIGPCLNGQINTPYVCKRIDSESCPTIDKGYKYINSLQKCYKVNRRPKTWDDAMLTCLMEGGLLTVIQNKAEADVIYDFLKMYSTYHVGVRRLFSGGGYYTLKGQNLDDVYHQDMTNQQSSLNDCGAVYVQGNNYLSITTSVCTDLLPFICEMEVKSEE